MPKQRKIIESWVDWRTEQVNARTFKDSFYRYSKYDDGCIMGEPIDQETYLKEKGY